MAWEPETLWLELSRTGVNVPVANRAKIMAARVLVTTGRFYYDALVFEKTIVTFNDDPAHMDSLDDAPVEYIAWASDEAYKIYLHYHKENVSYDREPIAYTGVQLYRHGLVVAPDQLHWAQEALDAHYPKDTAALRKKVQTAWAALPKGELKNNAYPETPLGVQLAKLAAVHMYFDTKSKALQTSLAQLTH
jgi:hypothetical protein